MAYVDTINSSNHQANLKERQNNLIELSDRYMHGDIDLQAFKDAEQKLLPNYRAATLELVTLRRKLSWAVGKLKFW